METHGEDLIWHSIKLRGSYSMLIDIRYGGGGSIIKGVIFHADRYQVLGGGGTL